ncbi:MAG: tRNA (N6-isopentenyl adenosine(37)-C2)-methylthiotransferase MiaB [Gammaproteobacteria bacterium]|nr:tRNA (N6-isopentenyl adenosine(37)-C2)-methylthiotransferase MiaB [Gammaproteobacteria bacterium]
MTKKLFIETHGCQMNEYDSSSMANLLKHRRDLVLTTVAEEADVILLNTCSVREKAQEKVFSSLGVYRELKEHSPHVLIGVGGCVASQEGEDILKRAPFVDVVFGPQTLHRLPELLEEARQKQTSVVDVSFPEIEKFDRLPAPRAEGPTAFVSIMEGCSKYCSYCIVPYTRGKEISRPFADVIREIASLAEQGVKEVNLLGQNVNDYRNTQPNGQPADLARLLYYVAAIHGIERIRFTTSHPLAFSDALIQAYADLPQLVNHLHLPVQSGSDRILGLMKRGYTAKDYLDKVTSLKAIRPQLSMSSDFIVGFPSETDEDFALTMKLIEEVGFDNSFSFVYSKRPGTPAAKLADNVSQDVKKARLHILQSRIMQNTARISDAMIGTIEPVLVHAISKRSTDELAGRTENNRVVNFPGPASLIGQMVHVRITQSRVNTLRGEWVNKKESHGNDI